MCGTRIWMVGVGSMAVSFFEGSGGCEDRFSSSYFGPMIWRPTGRRSGVSPAGIDAAGHPVALECMVNAPFQNCSGKDDVPVTDPGKGSLMKAGNRATGARTRS